MQTTTNAQLRPLDNLTPLAPAKDFLQTLDTALGWQSIKQTLLDTDPAITERPPCAPFWSL